LILIGQEDRREWTHAEVLADLPRHSSGSYLYFSAYASIGLGTLLSSQEEEDRVGRKACVGADETGQAGRVRRDKIAGRTETAAAG
jgi:hypothetical protein